MSLVLAHMPPFSVGPALQALPRRRRVHDPVGRFDAGRNRAGLESVCCIGTTPELVQPGKTGFTFRAGDSQDLARTCIDALSDDDKRHELAHNARHYVETERHWPTIVEGYKDIYQRAIARNRAR